MKNQDKLLSWAVELQSLAQAGLFYCQDKFDEERYQIEQIKMCFKAYHSKNWKTYFD